MNWTTFQEENERTSISRQQLFNSQWLKQQNNKTSRVVVSDELINLMHWVDTSSINTSIWSSMITQIKRSERSSICSMNSSTSLPHIIWTIIDMFNQLLQKQHDNKIRSAYKCKLLLLLLRSCLWLLIARKSEQRSAWEQSQTISFYDYDSYLWISTDLCQLTWDKVHTTMHKIEIPRTV